MKRKNQKAMALLMVTALSISSVFTMPASAKSAKPKLSKKRITMWAGTKKKVTIKNAKAVKKVVWKSGKKSVVILKKKTKKSVQLVAKKAGKATVTAKVKAGWKMYKLSCKVTVKKKTGTTVVPPVNTQEPAVVNPGDSSSVVKTAEPVKEPTEEPTRKPAVTATASPTATPTAVPTQKPTATPTAVPTQKPTATPTTEPTKKPTATPTAVPTQKPTATPTAVPTQKPTATPTTEPTKNPTATPTQTPTAAPTQKPATEKVTLAIDNTFINSSAYSSVWNGTVYNLLPLITASGHKVSDFTQVNVTINLLDANKNIIENTGGASIKLSVKNSDWAGFVDANGMQSGKEQGLQLDAYPSGQTALYLVVQNSTEAVKYIQITSVVMENKGKKDATEAIESYQSLASLGEKYGFKFGTNINEAALKNTELTKLIKYHFNRTTFSNEMKAYSLLSQSASQNAYVDENSPAVMNFTKADSMVAYAVENGLSIRGHVLTWDADMCDWFFREGYKTDGAYVSADVMKNRLKMYIDEVMTHFEEKYPGAIYCWDVVNEAVADNAGEFADDDVRHVRQVRGGKTNLFYDYIGSDYVELAFRYAYETRAKLQAANSKTNIKLFYNDYNTFATYGANKRDAIIQLVKSVNSFASDGNGGYLKLCDGIGMQSYIGGYGQQSGCMNDNDITLVKNAIEKFAENNVEVHVTELAVRNYDNDAEPEHAAFYKKLVQTYVDINKAAQAAGKTGPITSLSIWGLFDAPYLSTADYSYKMNGPYCGLFTELYQPKQSFKEVYEVLAAE